MTSPIDIDALARQKRAEMRRLQRELERLEKLKKKRLKVTSPEIRELSRQIQLLARDHMMNNEDVIKLVTEAVERYPVKAGRGGGRTGGVVPPKYRNPNNPEETWTGRGRKPRWVVALLEQGYTLDQLKIQD